MQGVQLAFACVVSALDGLAHPSHLHYPPTHQLASWHVATITCHRHYLSEKRKLSSRGSSVRPTPSAAAAPAAVVPAPQN